MLKLAQALQAAGATVYAVSLRGHGGSGTANGDVSYLGQLDDDLADLVKGLGLDKPGLHRTLAGFSSGGGLVLRIAGGRQAGLFDDYLAISPYIAQDFAHQQAQLGGMGGRGGATHRGAVAARQLRPAMVPGTVGRPLRHGSQGRQ